MNTVNITIEPNEPYRATEVVADLRNVAESLYFPMKLVGFRDSRENIHLCADEERHIPLEIENVTVVQRFTYF